MFVYTGENERFVCVVAAVLFAEVLFETGGSRKATHDFVCFEYDKLRDFVSCGFRSLLFLLKNLLDEKIQK